jgi:hypothetical protein
VKLRVFGFRNDEDGNIRVGVFPEGEEILVSSASFCRIARLAMKSSAAVIWLNLPPAVERAVLQQLGQT